MAPDVDATAGTPKSWYDLEAVLAEKPVAALLATYLLRCRVRQLPCHLAQGFSDSGVNGVYHLGPSKCQADAGRCRYRCRASLHGLADRSGRGEQPGRGATRMYHRRWSTTAPR